MTDMTVGTVRTEGAASPTDLAAVNRRAVLHSIGEIGTPQTVSELCRVTGLSRPTVAAAVSTLTGAGLVAELSPVGSSPRGGRPSRRYRFAADAYSVAAVVLSRTGIEVTVRDLDGAIQARRFLPVPNEYAGVSDIAQATGNLIDEALATPGAGRAQLSAIIVAVLGVVRDGREIVVSGLFPQLEGTRLHSYLESRFGVPVQLDNDANLAALAESMEIPSTEAMISLLIGVEFGCGIVLHGHVHRGAHGNAGELSYGVWEELFAHLHSALIEPSWKPDVFSCASEGNADAIKFTEHAARLIARGLLPVMEFLDPDLVVVGGEGASASHYITDPLSRAFFEELGWSPEVTTTSLATDTVSMGAHELGARIANSKLFA